MAKTKIEWTDKVWNPVTGCSKISEGCLNCYAEKFAKRLKNNPKLKGKYSNGFEPTFHMAEIKEHPEWKKGDKIFVGSMGDVFHEKLDYTCLDYIFGVPLNYPDCFFLFLTKRPDVNLKLFIASFRPNKFHFDKNIWLGVTAENQKRADERVPFLLETPCQNKFLSIEPMLGQIDITKYLRTGKLKWVICGGENGHNARPLHSEWVRFLMFQCRDYGVPFFFKGWGEWSNNTPEGIKLPSKSWAYVCPKDATISYGISKGMDFSKEYVLYGKVGKKNSGALIDGELIQQFPEELKLKGK